jgi:hypothetical protein
MQRPVIDCRHVLETVVIQHLLSMFEETGNFEIFDALAVLAHEGCKIFSRDKASLFAYTLATHPRLGECKTRVEDYQSISMRLSALMNYHPTVATAYVANASARLRHYFYSEQWLWSFLRQVSSSQLATNERLSALLLSNWRLKNNTSSAMMHKCPGKLLGWIALYLKHIPLQEENLCFYGNWIFSGSGGTALERCREFIETTRLSTVDVILLAIVVRNKLMDAIIREMQIAWLDIFTSADERDTQRILVLARKQSDARCATFLARMGVLESEFDPALVPRCSYESATHERFVESARIIFMKTCVRKQSLLVRAAENCKRRRVDR